jgi:hypothetical protein
MRELAYNWPLRLEQTKRHPSPQGNPLRPSQTVMHSDLPHNRMERLEFGIFRNLNRARIHQGEQVPFVIGQNMIKQRLFTVVAFYLEDWKLEVI